MFTECGRHADTWQASVPLTALRVELKAGTSDPQASPGSVIFDNLKLSRSTAPTQTLLSTPAYLIAVGLGTESNFNVAFWSSVAVASLCTIAATKKRSIVALPIVRCGPEGDRYHWG